MESAATLCNLRHRAEHVALATLSDHDSSSSASSCCFLAHTPEPRRKIIHSERLGSAALPVVPSIFFLLLFFRVGKQEDAVGSNVMEVQFKLEFI